MDVYQAVPWKHARFTVREILVTDNTPTLTRHPLAHVSMDAFSHLRHGGTPEMVHHLLNAAVVLPLGCFHGNT